MVNYLTALAIWVAALMLRVPFRSQMAYQWDSAQFALAIEHYDLTASQPHTPGYFLYVMFGRVLNFFVGDPHASLVWLSILAGAALAALGYLLGTALFGRGCGVATGAILATGPLCWFHSEVALTTIVDSALVTATILACWLAMRRGSWPSVLVMSALLAVTAGVRQQTAPVLLPVWFWTLSRLPAPRGLKWVTGVVVAVVIGSLWLVPTVCATGGLTSYVQLLQAKARFDAPFSPWGGGVKVLGSNVGMMVDACWAGLLGAGVIAVAGFGRWVFGENRERKRQFYDRHREQLILLALWALPMMVFSAATCITQPGYALNFFPAVAVVAGLAVWKVSGRRATLATVAVVGVNAAVFLAPAQWADRVLVGLPVSASHLRANDHRLTNVFTIIRSQFRPEQTLICHRDEYYFWSFRHFQYYLPEYRNVQLRHDSSLPGERAKKFWLGLGRRTEFIDRLPMQSDETVLLVVPPGQALKVFEGFFDISRAQEVGGADGKLFALGNAGH